MQILPLKKALRASSYDCGLLLGNLGSSGNGRTSRAGGLGGINFLNTLTEFAGTATCELSEADNVSLTGEGFVRLRQSETSRCYLATNYSLIGIDYRWSPSAFSHE